MCGGRLVGMRRRVGCVDGTPEPSLQVTNSSQRARPRKGGKAAAFVAEAPTAGGAPPTPLAVRRWVMAQKVLVETGHLAPAYLRYLNLLGAPTPSPPAPQPPCAPLCCHSAPRPAPCLSRKHKSTWFVTLVLQFMQVARLSNADRGTHSSIVARHHAVAVPQVHSKGNIAAPCTETCLIR